MQPNDNIIRRCAIPTCVTTARRVPKHYEPESKKTIAELIERKVIAPVDEPTTWCSPAFFVPKADASGSD